MFRSNSLRTSNANSRSEGMASTSISIAPILPISSPQLCSEVAMSGNEQHIMGTERPQSAQECSDRQRNFPQTPPSPSINDRIDGRPSGGVSSLFDSREGFVSPDLIDIEADDISNDSYLIDKDTKSLTNRFLQNNSNYYLDNSLKDIENFKELNQNMGQIQTQSVDSLLGLDTNTHLFESSKSVSEDIEYVLHKRKVKKNSNKKKNEKRRRAVSAPRVRSKSELNSCQRLFARTDRFSDCNIKPKNLHFVSLNSLPSFESYSSRDDTIQDSVQNLILDNFNRNHKLNDSEESINSSHKSDDSYFYEKQKSISNNEQNESRPAFPSLFDEIIYYNLLKESILFGPNFFEKFNEFDFESQTNSDSFNSNNKSIKIMIANQIIAMYLRECHPDDFDPNSPDIIPNDGNISPFELKNHLFTNTLGDLIIKNSLKSFVPDYDIDHTIDYTLGYSIEQS